MSGRYEETIEIRSYEADQYGNMKIDQAMRLMEELGGRQMRAEGLSYDDVVAQGKTILVNRMDADFYHPIRKLQIVKISSWPCYPHKMTVPRRYRMASLDGEVLADMIGQWTLVDIKEKKILKPDAIDFSCYHIEDLDIELPKREKFTRNLELKKIGESVVTYNEIDTNGHMNNVEYLKIVQPYIEELFEGWRISNFKINFAKEAMRGETISILRSDAFDSFHTEPIEALERVYKYRLQKEDESLSAEVEITLTK